MLKVLISAYSCIPGRGSEPGAGWSMVEGAAKNNEVWVLTNLEGRSELDGYLLKHPQLAERVHPVYVEMPPRLERTEFQRGDFYWHYPLWQFLAGRKAKELQAEVGFDVMHHATFAADWQGVGLMQVKELPLVWGPVGGATYPSLRTVCRWLPKDQVMYEVVRSLVTRGFRRVFAERVGRRAEVVVAMNHDTERRFRHAKNVVVEGNAVIDLDSRDSEGGVSALTRELPARKHAVYVGRLFGWKGVSIALRALTEPTAEDWDLTIIGDGPDEEMLRNLAADLGVADRVHFAGRRSRPDVIVTFTEADAMVFPSLHDSLSWAVAEAVTCGCPVVCVDLGGPPVAMGDGGIAVPPKGDIPAAIAQALAQTDSRIQPQNRFSATRLPGLLDEWYSLAIETHSRSV